MIFRNIFEPFGTFSKQFWTFHDFSKHFMTFDTFHNFSEHFRSFQNVPEHFRTFRNRFETLQNFSEHFKYFQNFSEHFCNSDFSSNKGLKNAVNLLVVVRVSKIPYGLPCFAGQTKWNVVVGNCFQSIFFQQQMRWWALKSIDYYTRVAKQRSGWLIYTVSVLSILITVFQNHPKSLTLQLSNFWKFPKGSKRFRKVQKGS